MHQKYRSEQQAWRRTLDENLRGEKSWLALTGLYWLAEGENAFGSHPDHSVPLPPGKAPEFAGIFRLERGIVSIEVRQGVEVAVNASRVTSMALKADVSGEPDEIDLGRLSMRVVKRGERYGIRIWDKDNPRRTQFQGRRWFSIDPAYILQARFFPYDPPREIPITNILGDTEPEEIVGYLEFELEGRVARLEAIGLESGQLYILFKDETNAQLTYPAGRYLYTDPPQDGKVSLDFNRAYNPPCAFTDFATCPLPPKENHLPFPVAAGELLPGD